MWIQHLVQAAYRIFWGASPLPPMYQTERKQETRLPTLEEAELAQREQALTQRAHRLRGSENARYPLKEQTGMGDSERELLLEMFGAFIPIAISRTEARLKSEAELAMDFRQQPTNDLAATVLQSAETVRNVAYKSKNLHGVCQKSLKEMSLMIRAATSVLVSRSQTNPKIHQQVLEEMRKELQDLRYDNQQLRSQLANLQEKLDRRERAVPPRLKREAAISSFFSRQGEQDMEVEAGYKDLQPDLTPMSAPQLRRKNRVDYTGCDGSGEGEVIVMATPSPPRTPEPVPPPMPQRNPKGTRTRGANKGGNISNRLIPMPSHVLNTKEVFRKEDPSKWEEQPTANPRLDKTWDKRDKLITEMNRIKNKIQKMEEENSFPKN